MGFEESNYHILTAGISIGSQLSELAAARSSAAAAQAAWSCKLPSLDKIMAPHPFRPAKVSKTPISVNSLVYRFYV